MRVPFIDLDAQHGALRAATLAAFAAVLDSQRFVLGPEVEALEAELAARCGAAFGIGVSSGTDALLLSLLALGVGPGDEVITSPFSFFATAEVIVRLGATPVFVDIDPATFNLDPGELEAAITPRTRAVMPVHLFGQMADMVRILEISERHQLPVVEDAAQAIGASAGALRAGGAGRLAALSFYPTKNLGGVGDGGMVLSSDAALASRLRQLRQHGHVGDNRHAAVGGNFRMDALQAAALRVRLPHLARWTEARRATAAAYDAAFVGSAARPPRALPGHHSVYHQYTLRAPNRDGLRAHLLAQGIGSGVYYPLPLHLQPALRHLGLGPGALPEAERAANEVLSLPIWPGLQQSQIAAVIDAVRAFYGEA